MPLSNLLVGLEAGSIVGAVALDVVARRGLIVAVAVSGEHQDGNVAASLVSSLIARAHELGLRELYAPSRVAGDVLTRYGFGEVPEGGLPDEVRSMRSYPGEDGVVYLELETRL